MQNFPHEAPFVDRGLGQLANEPLNAGLAVHAKGRAQQVLDPPIKVELLIGKAPAVSEIIVIVPVQAFHDIVHVPGDGDPQLPDSEGNKGHDPRGHDGKDGTSGERSDRILGEKSEGERRDQLGQLLLLVDSYVVG